MILYFSLGLVTFVLMMVTFTISGIDDFEESLAAVGVAMVGGLVWPLTAAFAVGAFIAGIAYQVSASLHTPKPAPLTTSKG